MPPNNEFIDEEAEVGSVANDPRDNGLSEQIKIRGVMCEDPRKDPPRSPEYSGKAQAQVERAKEVAAQAEVGTPCMMAAHRPTNIQTLEAS